MVEVVAAAPAAEAAPTPPKEVAKKGSAKLSLRDIVRKLWRGVTWSFAVAVTIASAFYPPLWINVFDVKTWWNEHTALMIIGGLAVQALLCICIVAYEWRKAGFYKTGIEMVRNDLFVSITGVVLFTLIGGVLVALGATGYWILPFGFIIPWVATLVDVYLDADASLTNALQKPWTQTQILR